MKLAVAKLQLKGKLAEAAEHSIACKRLPVASMPQEMRLQKRFGGLISESEVLLRASHESFEPCSMSNLEMFFACSRFASSIAPTKAEQHEELKPSDPDLVQSVNRYDLQVLPENPHLSFSLRFRFSNAERW